MSTELQELLETFFLADRFGFRETAAAMKQQIDQHPEAHTIPIEIQFEMMERVSFFQPASAA